MARTYMAALLLEHAQWSGKDVDVEVANTWARKYPLALFNTMNVQTIAKIALDIDPASGKPRGCGSMSIDGKPRSRY